MDFYDTFYKARFRPSDVQEQCGINLNTLREWRQRFSDFDIGTVGKTGRWKYSPADLTQLAIIHMAIKSRIEGRVAFSMARLCAPCVWHFWGMASSSPQRYTFVWRCVSVHSNLGIDQEFDYQQSDSLTDIGEVSNNMGIAFLFDGKAFAEQYRTLGDWIKGTLENQARVLGEG